MRWILALCAAAIALSGCAAEPPKQISQCVGAECNGHTPAETGCENIRESWGRSVYTHGEFGDLRGQLMLYRGVPGSDNRRCKDVYWATFRPFENNAADFYVVTPLRGYDDEKSVVYGKAGSTDPVSSNAMFAGERYPVNACVEATTGDMPAGQMTRRMCLDVYPDNLPVPPFDMDTF